MKPASFAYYRPNTLDEALALLAEHGSDAKPLAGGQSLVPTMNFRLAQPAVLVDLNALAGLAHIDVQGSGLRIGAMTRQRAVERDPRVADRLPLVHEAVPWVGHPPIRNRGTLGGSLAHADPAAEMPAVMLASEARFHLRMGDDARVVPAEEFFTGLFATAVRPGELLVEIEVPGPPAGAGWAFTEVARRRGDFALVGVAALVTCDEAGACRSARAVYLSVGDGPVLSRAVAEALEGNTPTAEAIRAAADAAATTEVDPPRDIHASADYRRHLVRVLGARALTRAFQRARRAGGAA